MAIRPSEWKGGLTLAVALILALSCGTSTDEPAAEPEPVVDREQAVVEAHRALVRAYESADIDALLALLEPSPELLIFHPRLENRFDGIDEIRDNLGRMFARIGPVTWTDVHPFLTVRGDTAWLTYQLLLSAEDGSWAFAGRGTELWVRGDAGWRLAHGHWSPQPMAGG